jgi:putative PIN family toxin of toxin-antitoxin system
VRLFLDTNVLVSAFAVRGLSTDLLDVVLLEHDLVTGRAVLQELEKALRAKIKLPAERCAEIVEYVSSEAVLVAENASPASCNAEEDDRLVLGEALLAGAEAFVTGDAALVALGSVEGMRILTPRQLWDLLRSG